MHAQTRSSLMRHALIGFTALSMIAFSPIVRAELPADVKAKAESYKKKLTEWAANPMIVKAVKEANAKGPIDGMTNAKWDDLPDNSPLVQATVTGPVSNQLKQWEEDKGINKLFLRDNKANLISGVSKSFLYNAATRPQVASALKGEAMYTNEIKPDPTTQIKSIQLAVPVMDGGKAIGVLHTAVTAQ